MFDSAATQEFQTQLADAYAVTCRERDWIKLHEEITSVGKQIVCLEAREVELLLEAEETKLYRRMGFPTIYAYIEGVLQHSHHVATERMRVAHELIELPGIAEEFRTGALPWTSVRELTRVATRKTEDAWLDAAEGKLSTDVQQLVRGKAKGDLPGDPVDPKKIRHRIVLDGISEESMMLFAGQEHRGGMRRKGRAPTTSFRRALAAGARSVRGTPQGQAPGSDRDHDMPRACKQAHRGRRMEVGVPPRSWSACAATRRTSAISEREEPGRKPQKSIPDATRRKVFVPRQVPMQSCPGSSHQVPGGAPHQAARRGWRPR
ncbi:MAG: DUF222 domain-containing protein, partial [Myxococcales bacterium]|nr:DUF222 domain-containing protein [Myxococcales bacterium]